LDFESIKRYKNAFFEITIPKTLRAKFVCSQHLDAKSIVFEAKMKNDLILVLAWDRCSDALAFQRDSYVASLTAASGEGVRKVGDQTRQGLVFVDDRAKGRLTWLGGVIETSSPNGVFSDFEVITIQESSITYLRYFEAQNILAATKGVEAVIESISIARSDLWKVEEALPSA
jgi:hypothetical protein